MSLLYLFSLLLAGGLAVWFLAQAFEKRKTFAKVHLLENKLKLTENRAIELQRQITLIQNEKDQALTKWHASVKKGAAVATFCLAGGLILGSVSGWLGSKLTIEAQQNRQLIEFEMNERIAVLKAEIVEKEFTELKNNYEILEKSSNELAVEKAVAEAKLEILLKNIVIEKGGQGFIFDYKKMKKDWQSSKSQVILNNREFVNPVGT